MSSYTVLWSRTVHIFVTRVGFGPNLILLSILPLLSNLLYIVHRYYPDLFLYVCMCWGILPHVFAIHVLIKFKKRSHWNDMSFFKYENDIKNLCRRCRVTGIIFNYIKKMCQMKLSKQKEVFIKKIFSIIYICLHFLPFKCQFNCLNWNKEQDTM